MSHSADDLIAAWLTDDLDADGVRALEEALRSDPTVRARFARFCQSEVVLAQALDLAPVRPGTTGIRRAVRGGSKRMRLRRPDGRLNWVLPAAAAALVAVIVLVTVMARPVAPDPVVVQQGPLELLKIAGALHDLVLCEGRPLRVGMYAPRGATLEIRATTAEFRWRDGTQVTTTSGTRLRVVDGEAALELLSGNLEAHVTARTTTPFRIDTPHVSAAVMGTRFGLGVRADTTALAVSEGRVRFTAGHTQREVIAGESATADANGLRLDAEVRVLGFVPTGREITRVLGPRMVGRCTLRLIDLPAAGINLRVDCLADVRSVRTGMRGVDSRLEQVPAFHVFGDVRNRATTAWKPHTGTFLIDAQPCADVDGRQPLGPAVVFELTIVP